VIVVRDGANSGSRSLSAPMALHFALWRGSSSVPKTALHRLRRIGASGPARAHHASRPRDWPRTLARPDAPVRALLWSRLRMMNVVCVVEHGDWTDESGQTRARWPMYSPFEGSWHPTVRILSGALSIDLYLGAARSCGAPSWRSGPSRSWRCLLPCCPMMAQGRRPAIEDGVRAPAMLLKAMPRHPGALASL